MAERQESPSAPSGRPSGVTGASGGTNPHWSVITPSAFPWEREALEFIKARFPAHEPYRAWSNEFIADDGSLNEVDLLAFTPQGFFLVEIKSFLGILSRPIIEAPTCSDGATKELIWGREVSR